MHPICYFQLATESVSNTKIFELDPVVVVDSIKINKENKAKCGTMTLNCRSILFIYFPNFVVEFSMSEVRVVSLTLVGVETYMASFQSYDEDTNCITILIINDIKGKIDRL